MGILDQLPEEYDYVDYRPTLNTALLSAGATAATVLAARGLMKGFGKKTGKGLSGSKTKMKGSVNLNKRPGKGKMKKSKKAKKAAKAGQAGASAASAYGPDDLPMYSKGSYDPAPAYTPKAQPPAFLTPRPKAPKGPKPGGLKRSKGLDDLSAPPPGPLARSGGYANLGPKMKTQPLKRQGGLTNLSANFGSMPAKPKANLTRSGGMSDLRSKNMIKKGITGSGGSQALAAAKREIKKSNKLLTANRAVLKQRTGSEALAAAKRQIAKGKKLLKRK